jgi:competence ComEA-like helix-hairpin-helix protein
MRLSVRTPRERSVRSLWFRALFMASLLGLTTGFMAQSASAGKTLRVPTERAKSSQPAEGVININDATVDQLVFLPGIGLRKAERIFQYRLRKRFRLVSHLARVKGIGPKTVRKLRQWLRLGGPTTVKTSIPSRSSRSSPLRRR